MSQNFDHKPITLYTDHHINRYLCYNFALGSKSLMCHVDNFKDFKNKIIATYGYLRGTGEAIKKSKNFFYMDHGYFKQSDRVFSDNKAKIINFNGYFRIVFNDFWHDGSGMKKSDRLEKLKINFKEQKKTGSYIILSEPTKDASIYYKLNNWVEDTKLKLIKYTDREIITHNRDSKTPLTELLKNAWAFVSDHSSAGFKSMIEGVPAYFTNSTLSRISSLNDIELHKIDYNVFNNLAYEQWKIEEIKSGEAWDYLSKKIKYNDE